MSDLVGHIHRGDTRAARESIRQGADINATDQEGFTPLMDAILTSDWSLEMVRLLLDSGASVHVADKKQHWTPLHFASRDGKPELVRLLLQRGAPVDAVDTFGNTPLWGAITAHQNTVEVITLLLDAGANPHTRNKTGVSPLDVARKLQRTQLVDLLNT